MNIVPSNEYLLVMPSGNVKGFDDYAMAKAYINNYYYYIYKFVIRNFIFYTFWKF